ncbi:MAG: hypothetical protein LKE85_11165 [Lachnospiraceae bacterium]|nr:hypothetical protein [Lachnospiraceae bacterium]MDD5848536.1 hypothetical protein [Bacillota bacterium]
MNEKKWFRGTVILLAVLIIAMGVAVIVVDPYYHFHKPLKGIEYRGQNALYNNNGMLRNFDYDALIIGTSMTSGFSEEEASQLFGENFIRTTFLGEGFYILNENMKTALVHQHDLKHVIRSVDTLWFVTPPDWTSTAEYPDYLYDENPFNDVRYLYNIDVWDEAMIPTVVASISHSGDEHEDDSSEDAKADAYLNHEEALNHYERPEKSDDPIDPSETEEWYQHMQTNLTQNLTDTIAQYPDVRFDLFFPPYSILWWDSANQAGPGRVDRRVDMEEYAIDVILKYPNVHLYSLNDDFNLITDLSNYADDIHYHPNVNSIILQSIHDGEHEITKENATEYIDSIRKFYNTYDYDAIFTQNQTD